MLLLVILSSVGVRAVAVRRIVLIWSSWICVGCALSFFYVVRLPFLVAFERAEVGVVGVDVGDLGAVGDFSWIKEWLVSALIKKSL